jgi:hypothetical protein
MTSSYRFGIQILLKIISTSCYSLDKTHTLRKKPLSALSAISKLTQYDIVYI